MRFLYDYLGSKAWGKKKLQALEPLGVQVAADMTSLSRINYRDHRKIVVIDGEIGYTGGYNVGQEYVDGGKRFARWRDTHLRVTGQVVGELQTLFARRWFENRKEDLLGEQYLPAPPRSPEDGILCQVVAQTVEDPWQSSRRVHMVAVGNAERRVWIQSPYFVPEVGLYDTMINAALTGVDVRFMMTGMPDKKVPYWAAWSYFRPLIEAGAHIYLYEAGFLHSKTIVADSQVAAIGTMNMDIRSLKLHKELMVWLFDEGLARSAGATVRGGHRRQPRGDARGARRAQRRGALPQLVHAVAVLLHLDDRQGPSDRQEVTRVADKSDMKRRIIGATIGGAPGGTGGAVFGSRIGATVGAECALLVGHCVEHVLRRVAARRHPVELVPR